MDELTHNEELFTLTKQEFSYIYNSISGFMFYREEGNKVLVKTASISCKRFLRKFLNSPEEVNGR